MCGITGFISPKLNRNDLIRMTDSLSHRGPNANGIYFDENKKIGLGHRRLSIIDVSISANQPMTSASERYCIVYNGEVYNFKKIAKKLSISLRTTSDTEVILEAFEKWGVNFVQQLNGMFSIAIFDKINNELFLFRDRLGIKPLFYYWDNNQFIFGSELKAIKQVKTNLSINFSVISSFLHLGYIPQNHTIFNNTYKLSAGYYGVFKKNTFNIQPFWELTNCIKQQTISNFKDAKKALKAEINTAVKRRMISDVPLGTFLSGGIDSSLVSAIAAQHSSTKLNTFSIGFKDAKHDESSYAKKVATHLNSNHHEFILTQQDALDALNEIIDNFDQPFADSSALPTFLVSKMAKKQVTVCLSGDGGDELFMGYGSYNWAKRLANPFIWGLRSPISKALKLSPNTIHQRASKLFTGTKTGLKSHIFSQEQYLFSENEISQILPQIPNIQSINTPENYLNRKLTPIEQQSFFDIKNYLKDDLLVKVDMASMLSSLEVRVPLLDHNIVELSVNIDEKLKFHPNGTQKFILKEILYDYVPKPFFDRPKWGFSIPLQNWMQNELHYLIDKYLNTTILEELGIYNVNKIQQLIYRFEKGETYLYNRLWVLIVLNRFLKNFNTN